MLPRVRLLALLGLALFPFAAPAQDPEEKPAEKKESTATIAHIKLSGSFDEGVPNHDPLFGGISETYKAKLDRIKKAKNDPAIGALYLQIDGADIGWAKLDELSKAVADCRAAGKKVFAFIENGDLKDYLLALSADEVCLPPPGWLMLTGVRAEVSFYKELFEKIGVQADMLQMGDAKTAAEPYTRTKLSDASRKQLQGVLDDRFDHGIVARIVKCRPAKHFTPEQVRELIDKGPYTARGAAAAGLVDKIAYNDEYQESFKATLQKDKVSIVKNYGQKEKDEIDLSSPFAILKLLAPPKPTTNSKPKIAVIYAVGPIVTGKGGSSPFGGEACGSTTMVEAIRQAENDKTVKAIVLRVDSPGGSAVASDLIWHELARSKKPVLASMSDVAGSGGYYICMSAKKIYADPGTLTGSIGVVGGKLALGGVFDKVGITTDVLSRGANANIFSTTTRFTPSEKEAMTALMRETYDQFLDKALAGRKQTGKDMTKEALLKIAGGRIWTGRQALENGLIDQLGSLDDALKEAVQLAHLPADKEPELLLLPKPKNFLDALMEGKMDATSGVAQQLQPLARQFPELLRVLRGAASLLELRGEPVWLTLPYSVEIK